MRMQVQVGSVAWCNRSGVMDGGGVELPACEDTCNQKGGRERCACGQAAGWRAPAHDIETGPVSFWVKRQEARLVGAAGTLRLARLGRVSVRAEQGGKQGWPGRDIVGVEPPWMVVRVSGVRRRHWPGRRTNPFTASPPETRGTVAHLTCPPLLTLSSFPSLYLGIFPNALLTAAHARARLPLLA